MNYEGAPFLRKTSDKEVLNRITRDLESIAEKSMYNVDLVNNASNIEELKFVVNRNLIYVNRKIEDYIKYCKSMYVEISNADERLIEIEGINETLLKALEVKSSEIRDMDNKIRELSELVGTLKSKNVSLVEQCEYTDKLNKVLSLVEDYSKTIALGVNMKKTAKKRLDTVKTADIVLDYLENNMNLEEIGRKYSLAGNTIKARLVNAGVYKYRDGRTAE